MVGHLKADIAAVNGEYAEGAGSEKPTQQLRDIEHAVLLIERRLADLRPH